MKRSRKTSTGILTGIAAILFSVAGVFAQETPGQQQPQTAPQQQAPEQQAPEQQVPGQVPGQAAPEVKEDFPDETLEKFVDINKKLAPHQQKGEAEMVKAIEEQGMDAERFGEIMTARQMNDSTSAGASDDELKKVDAAAQDIMGIQQQLQQQMTKVIVDEGMEIEEFQDIILAYQYSPKVQQKINDLIQAEQGGGAPADSGQTAPVEE